MEESIDLAQYIWVAKDRSTQVLNLLSCEGIFKKPLNHYRMKIGQISMEVRPYSYHRTSTHHMWL